MKYYKGAVSYTEIENMTISEVLNLHDSAVKIEAEIKKEANNE